MVFFFLIYACIRDKRGARALHIAAYKEQINCAQVLIMAGADVNATDSSGVSALHHASFKSNKDFVDLLIASQAQVNLRDAHGQTPLANA